MPIELESYQDMIDLLVAAARARFPNANLVKYGGFYKRLAVVALGMTDLQWKLRQVQDALDPLAATGDDLDRIGNIWGVERKGAVGATGSAALRVFGEPGALPVTDLVLAHAPTGMTFETRSGGTIPAEGYLDLDIAATSTGVQTNLEEDEELQFDSPPTDVETVAQIVIDLTGGIDQEADGDYRARILDRIGQPDMGGNRNDFEEWTLASAAYVHTAYVYPHRNGLGTVDIAALKTGSGTARLLDSGERDEVLEYLEEERPVTSQVRVLEVTTTAQDVEILVKEESEPAYAFDWDDSTAPTVDSYDSPTRTLTFEDDRPISMAVGDRVIPPGGEGEEFVIEALESTDAVVLTEDLGFTPTASGPVYSGGPVVQPAREAVLALFDSLGPANPDDVAYGPWEGNLRTASLFEVVQTSTGILDSDVTTPAANVEADDPAWPNNETIELIIPGEILIRKDHS